MAYLFATPAQKQELEALKAALVLATEKVALRDAIAIKYSFDLSQIVSSNYSQLVNNLDRWNDPHPDADAVAAYVNEGGKVESPYTSNKVIAAWQILKAQNSKWSAGLGVAQNSGYNALKKQSPATRANIEAISKRLTEQALAQEAEAKQALLTFEKFLADQEDTKETVALDQQIKGNIAAVTSDPVKLTIAIVIVFIIILIFVIVIKKLKP